MNTSLLTNLGSRMGLPIVVSLIGALLVTGCMSPETRDVGTGSDNTQPGSSANGLNVLLGMGFARDKIVEMKDGFVVEDDMYFLKKALAGAKVTTSQRAERAVNTPLPNKLTLAIHSSLNVGDWTLAVHQAVNNLNNLKTRLHIEVVPSGSGNITVYSDESESCPADFRHLPSNILGRGVTALTGEVGYAICMNMENPSLGVMGQKVATLTHEIGHTVALEHTDGNLGTLLAGTANVDDGSIMNSYSGSTGILSQNDILAFEFLYPSDKPLGGASMDADNKDDLLVWRPSDGTWRAALASTNFAGFQTWQWGQSSHLPMEDTDIDGDGRDDLVVWDPNDGYWHVVNSSSGAFRSIQWGKRGDVPLANTDIDGDTRDDLVIWRWTTGKFSMLTSRSNYKTSASFTFGQAGDIPVGGIDTDRDGTDDLVLFRPAEGRFYVAYSSSGFSLYRRYTLGQSGDIPVGSCDVDRDGRDDLVVWRPSSGTWYALTSRSSLTSSSSYQWGERGDVPIIGTDFDQDGKRDITVWRPTDHGFYILNSNAIFTTGSVYFFGM